MNSEFSEASASTPGLFRILLLDTKRKNPNHYLCLALEDALRRCATVARVTKVHYGNALEKAQSSDGYNLFLAFDGEDIEEAICAKLARLCGRSILWVTEDPYELHTNLINARRFDLVLTNDLASVSAYEGRARHLPLAADQKFHLQTILPHNHPYLYDVFFAGTAWPNRVDLLRDLTHRMADVKFKIALPANPYLPHPQIGQPKAAFNWRTPSPEFCRMANRSRITLSLHREFSGSGNPELASTPGPRLFEVALAGSFQLTDSRLEEVATYYRFGEEYDTFTDMEDCERKIRQYLEDGPRREAMARAAQENTLAHHLYDHRVQDILSFAAEIPVAAPPMVVASVQKPNLLFVAHNTVAGGVFGGVEVVMKLLSEGLCEQYNIFCYVPISSDERSVGAILYGQDLIELRRFDFPLIERNSHLSCPVREQVFAQILQDYRIDLVHYHHLIGHVPSLPLISRAYGIRATLTVYDYFPVCTNFNLLDYKQRFCHIEDRSLAACDVCLNAMYNFPRHSQERRLAFQERVLDACDALVFISQDTLTRCKKIFPQAHLPEKSLLIDLPVPYNEAASHTSKRRWQKPYKVVSFGNFTHAKGADVMLRAFNQLREAPFEFHLYGRLDAPYTDILQALQIPNVYIHGQFAPGSLQAALEDAALSLHVSIWPETFCITVAEAMHFGVVPIVTSVGAPDERVTDCINGFKIPSDDPGALVELFNHLAVEPELMRVCHENICSHHVHMPADHIRAMADHYGNLIKIRPNFPAVTGHAGANLTLAGCGVELEHVSWCGMPTLGYVQASAEKMEATLERSVEAAAGALFTDSLEQKTYHDVEPAGNGSTLVENPTQSQQTGASLYAPTYIAKRFARLTRERGLAYALGWHVKTLRKIFGGSKQ